MNILYISYLLGDKWEGPNYSIPSQIQAQAGYDNVLWFNTTYAPKDCWNVNVKYLNLTGVPKAGIENLPQPFDKPDLAVFEGLYTLAFCKIAKQLKEQNIPYVIIPRSSLTSSGQQSKALKKKIGNAIFFNKFIKDAAAVQYLTYDEYKSSGGSWNKTSLIIPNGTEEKKRTRKWDSRKALKGVFIGRIDIYQKGIDMFLEACAALKSEMRAACCTIDLYGPDQRGAKAIINKQIAKYQLEDFINIYGPVFDDEKEKVLLGSDFFILTSRFEGHPMALIEALSYGLPCLVTAGSNMTDEINKANAGWTAENNTESITKALSTLLNDKDQFAEKGQNALELSRQYNWDAIAAISSRKYKDLLSKILS